MKTSPTVLLLPLMLAVALLAGCTAHNIYPMANAYPVNNAAYSGGPPVTLRPVEESLAADPGKAAPYKADPNYLGGGLKMLVGYGPLPMLPIVWSFDGFQADCSRVEIVRSAILAQMKASGIPIAVRGEDGTAPSVSLPEDNLSVSIHIREMKVDTDQSHFLTLIIDSAFEYRNQIANVILDCQIWQPGQTKPVWEGTVEGNSRTKGALKPLPPTFQEIVQHINVVQNAVSDAAEKCVTKLAETRTAVCNQRYAKLMKSGLDLEDEGDTTKAMEDYGQASLSATTAEQDAEAMRSLVRLLRVNGTQPALPEEARKLKMQAEAAFRDGRFDAASQLYGDTLTVAPWWAEGHSELALLLGASGHYSQAIREMKRYTALAPNAPDIRNANDKLYEWKRKLSSPTL